MLLVKKVEELEAKMEEQIKQISNDWGFVSASLFYT